MPPSQGVRIERMLKRVDNAIHNPTQSYEDVRDALVDLRAANIRPSKDEIDAWIQMAIESNNRQKLLCFLKYPKAYDPGLHTCLGIILVYYPQHIAQFVDSPIFSNTSLDELDVSNLMQPWYKKRFDISLKFLFRLPKATKLCIDACNDLKDGFISKNYLTLLHTLNPVLRKRKLARKVLLRFWLLTTKPILRSWRESLYVPGTGALYKKALASFTESV